MKEFTTSDFLILVVDDIASNLQIIGEILDDVGYGTTFAISGKQALERIFSARPDLILLDLMMPDMNGLRVCEILKANPSYQDIPIIFLTASNEQNNLLQAFEKGAVDYITKPFNSRELLARVKTHLELKYTRDELKKALAELEKLATTDPLTGIANRRHLLTLGEQEFSRVCRYDRPFSILMIDLDRFKNINDTYGHSIGDEILKKMAKVTLSVLGTVDYFGRFGGEEFVILLPETNVKDAKEVAEKVGRKIAEMQFIHIEKIIKITVSIGVAAYQIGDTTIDDILRRADDALYQAKGWGRDRVVVSKESS
ncbi:MAG: diguanylate cyclase [Cyanobacteria bacterium SBLK]|nr:diguanylate cyclase [Cyanobacteria bacterium SBLK]